MGAKLGAQNFLGLVPVVDSRFWGPLHSEDSASCQAFKELPALRFQSTKMESGGGMEKAEGATGGEEEGEREVKVGEIEVRTIFVDWRP